jgi:hydrogenase maturation protease
LSRFPVVIGIGNLLRRDDGAGILAARRLRAALPSFMSVYESAADVSELLDLFARTDHVILIDAVAGIPDGDILHQQRADLALSKRSAASSHALSLAQILDLAHALAVLPRIVSVYGIGGSDFGIGEGVSDSVARGIDTVVKQICAALQQTASHAPQKP